MIVVHTGTFEELSKDPKFVAAWDELEKQGKITHAYVIEQEEPKKRAREKTLMDMLKLPGMDGSKRLEEMRERQRQQLLINRVRRQVFLDQLNQIHTNNDNEELIRMATAEEILAMDRHDTETYYKRKIKEIRKLVEENKKSEALKLMDEILGSNLNSTE